jgi:hypothetical protein
VAFSVADPDPGSGAFLTTGSGIRDGKKPGSGMNNSYHISESLKTIFWVEILKFFDADQRDGKNSNRDDKSSDPQHWWQREFHLGVSDVDHVSIDVEIHLGPRLKLTL